MAAMSLNISILLLSCNNPQIQLCLDLLLEQITHGDEIIVCDDHSDVASVTLLRQYERQGNIKLITPDQKGNRSHNRNLAAKHARNPILLFLDGDMLIGPCTISAIRRGHTACNEIAFIGTRHGVRYTPGDMCLYSGLSNYEELLQTEAGRNYLYHYPLFSDGREDTFLNPKHFRYYWAYYFTCCCTVEKWAFERVGGFDETFCHWGAEDVDFAFRISRLGRIGYLPEFFGLHVPHKRDYLYSEWSNYRNIGYMLQKYKCWEMELLRTYRADSQMFVDVELFLEQMGMISCPPLNIVPIPDTLYIEAVSKEFPWGRITCYFGDSSVEQMQMLGLALWLPAQQMQTVYLSGGILAYPQALQCGIFQEALRIGRRVVLCGGAPAKLRWGARPDLSKTLPQYRCNYLARDISDFSFQQEADGIRIRTELPGLMNEEYIVPPKPPSSELESISRRARGSKYCLIDFTENRSGAILSKRLESDLGISILGRYSCAVEVPDQPIWGSQLVLGNLLGIRQPVLLLCQDLQQIQWSDPAWAARNNPLDLVADCQGHLQWLDSISAGTSTSP